MLPKRIQKVGIPPIKCQGIKTKLVPFIASSIRWNGRGRWIEPFLGSGVVALNIEAKRALLADSNIHIIRFYQGIQQGTVTPESVRTHLEHEGANLLKRGEDHYYAVRERFNSEGDPHDFLFLNRACFNGVIRFNRKGEFNVPFCRKPDRFRPAYVTKIVNQVDWVARKLRGKDWIFVAQDWRETLAQVNASDFVYLDPPYVGRHADYYNQWTDRDAIALAKAAKQLPCGFAYSMWAENRYRENIHLKTHFHGFSIRLFSHYYHVGSRESFRNEMLEGLVIPSDHAAEHIETPLFEQEELPL